MPGGAAERLAGGEAGRVRSAEQHPEHVPERIAVVLREPEAIRHLEGLPQGDAAAGIAGPAPFRHPERRVEGEAPFAGEDAHQGIDHALRHRPAGKRRLGPIAGRVALADDPPIVDDHDGAGAPRRQCAGLREGFVQGGGHRRGSEGRHGAGRPGGNRPRPPAGSRASPPGSVARATTRAAGRRPPRACSPGLRGTRPRARRVPGGGFAPCPRCDRPPRSRCGGCRDRSIESRRRSRIAACGPSRRRPSTPSSTRSRCR